MSVLIYTLNNGLIVRNVSSSSSLCFSIFVLPFFHKEIVMSHQCLCREDIFHVFHNLSFNFMLLAGNAVAMVIIVLKFNFRERDSVGAAVNLERRRVD